MEAKEHDTLWRHKTTIGRSSQRDIDIDDPTVARLDAEPARPHRELIARDGLAAAVPTVPRSGKGETQNTSLYLKSTFTL